MTQKHNEQPIVCEAQLAGTQIERRQCPLFELEQPAVCSHVGIIFVHVQAPAPDTTFYHKLSWQLTAHDKLFSSCATNSIFSFDVVRCLCSHSDITPPEMVLWWM